MSDASAHVCGPVPDVAIVIPVKNEGGNIAPLIAEIAVALKGQSFEVIYIDDGSSDGTQAELKQLAAEHAWLRVLRHARSYGQSVAIRSGVAAARAPVIVTLDGDGQNDPAFIPKVIELLEADGSRIGLVAGQRVRRKATTFRKLQSRIANTVRGAVLGDQTRDTGCGLKAFRRDLFLRLPYFDGLHRFLPALVRREGLDISYLDIVDRPRLTGTSNYGLWNRLWLVIVDLFGVWWLVHRKHVPEVLEVKINAD